MPGLFDVHCNGMVYLYNPTICPHLHGRFTFPAKNYTVIDEETAAVLKEGHSGMLLETDPDFPPLWLTWPDTDLTRKLL